MTKSNDVTPANEWKLLLYHNQFTQYDSTKVTLTLKLNNKKAGMLYYACNLLDMDAQQQVVAFPLSVHVK